MSSYNLTTLLPHGRTLKDRVKALNLRHAVRRFGVPGCLSLVETQAGRLHVFRTRVREAGGVELTKITS